MKVIVGLGNPGKQYEHTRHNIGFMIVDELSDRFNIPLNQTKFNGMFGMGHVQGEKVCLLKPLTYMNLSGESLRPLMDYYDVEIEDIVVIYDDLDLPAGKIRLRQKGSPGGHNGIKSIIQHVHTDQFKRVRVGIGRPQTNMKVVDYVLGRFTDDEMISMKKAMERSILACEKWLNEPFLNVMNTYNS
ncbi:aminoacyl-tRNA hydrolase [Priestia filamentosa]|uniref:aminoacyl-tRNA hydrolase n=1 Tax=Priestia filamentosa TaxID=1402861 RepID=UPI001FB4642F|nr:aminoacyl-tRNA hydrolase [Priestia filamentosa]UOE60565.1 aminoacyl-tRNA hydrolase [Priestia filamentosa]